RQRVGMPSAMCRGGRRRERSIAPASFRVGRGMVHLIDEALQGRVKGIRRLQIYRVTASRNHLQGCTGERVEQEAVHLNAPCVFVADRQPDRAVELSELILELVERRAA